MAPLRVIAERLTSESPFPSITHDGTVRDGSFISQSQICRSCGNRSCATAADRITQAIPSPVTTSLCHKGLGVAVVRVSAAQVTLNGLVFSPHPVKLPRQLKKHLATQVITAKQIERWRLSVQDLITATATDMDASLRKTLGMFHDVQPTVNSILRNAEAYVATLNGETQEDKFERLPTPAKALVKATELLQKRLALMPLVSNPGAARNGARRSTRVYRLVDALVRTLRTVSAQRGVQIRLGGESFNQPQLYNSFDTIPFVLIDNAIKYSLDGETVEVEVTDTAHGVRIAVTSLSPFIAAEERGRLTEWGFRGEQAIAAAAGGSGLGLYLAGIVADAHGTRIELRCDGGKRDVNGIRYCLNTFSCDVE